MNVVDDKPSVVQPTSASTSEKLCGATEWAPCDDGKPHVYGVCELPPHPGERWHKQLAVDGSLWAEWSGDSGPIPDIPHCKHYDPRDVS